VDVGVGAGGVSVTQFDFLEWFQLFPPFNPLPSTFLQNF